MTAAADAKLALCVWRVGACLAAFIGWTDGQTPSNSVSVYPLVRWTSNYSDGLARQLCCINLFDYPYNITDALGIACSLSVGGTTVASLETMALSLRNHSATNSSVYGRLATFALNKTMADVQTAFGGTGTSYKKELQLLIRFELITGAEFSSSTLGGVNLGGRQNRQITSVWPNAYAYASIAVSATGLPIRCSDSSASLTLDDGIKTYLLENAVLPSVTSITEAGYSTLKTDAATAATKATTAAGIVGHSSYGNSAIQTVLRNLTKEVVGVHGEGVDVDGVSDKVDDLLDGYSTLKTNAATAATNASTAATQATNAASAVANNTYGLLAIKTAVSNVASEASTAASKATQAASYASSADSVVSSSVYGNAVLRSALASVATNASSAATDAAAAASAVVSGTYGNAAIKSALDSVATNASTAATQATLGASQATTAASQATNAAGYAYSASLDAASAASAVTSASHGNAALKSAIESACDKADRNWAGIEGEGVDEPSHSGIRAIGQAIGGVQTTANQNHALLYGVDNYHDGELVSHTDGVSDKVDDLLDGYSTLKTNANTAATKSTSAASQGMLAAVRSLAALDIVGHSTYGNQAIYNKTDSVYDLLAGVDDGEVHTPGVVDKLDALTSAVSDLADDVGTDPALVSRIAALIQTVEKLRASIALVRKGGVR